MNGALYGLGFLAFVWYILRNNRVKVYGHELPNLFGVVRYLRNLRDETSDETSDDEAGPPFCPGCPDQEGCSQGACHLDGGPNRPPPPCPDGDLCAHGGRHWPLAVVDEGTGRPERRGLDDDTGVLIVSREAVRLVDVSGDERYKTSAWKAREARERALRQADGIDLSFLNGASPTQRRAWVESWRRSHPDAPRSEIAHLLCRHGKITLRQAQVDIRAALGPAGQTG